MQVTQVSAQAIAVIEASPPPPRSKLERLAGLAVLSLPSRASQRNYKRVLCQFLASGHALSRDGVLGWLARLRAGGLGSSGLAVALAAIRLLAREAHERDLLDERTLASLERIKGDKRGKASTCGRWLELAEVKELLKAAKGARDAALLAVLVGCGLRREEAVGLEWSQYQERAQRWVLVDILGKGRKRRSVPVPDWVARYVEDWQAERGEAGPRVFGIGVDSVYAIVRQAGVDAGLGDVAPHDLRRTMAKLSRAGGAPLEQVQVVLGHTSLLTTQRYLGEELVLARGRACGDYIEMNDERTDR